MSHFSESSSDVSCFVFFHEYEDEDFEAFVSLVLGALNAVEINREQSPYSPLVFVEYEGHQLLLTCGSFEGCFISIDKSESWLATKIIDQMELAHG